MTDFEEFTQARTPQLLRSAWLLCGDSHHAEDLVQETLAKVYVRWHRRLGGAIDNPAAYAQTTLVRTFLSSRRRRSAHELPYAEVPDSVSPDPHPHAELQVVVAEALASLTPSDRAMLVMRYLEDRSVREVAQVLGLTEGAVRKRSVRALERLRPLIDSTHDLVPGGTR